MVPAIIAKIYSRWQTKAVNGAKITRGHINRTINYVLEHTPEKDRPRVLGGQGFEYAITDEETARRAGRDMEGLSDQGPPYPPGPRPNPLLHISLSWPPSENPSDEHMVESGRSALRALGTERAWGVFVRHHDTEHHHMHFVGSRIDPETRSTFAALRGYNRDRPKMLEWARGYERQRELEHTPERTLDRQPERSIADQWSENLRTHDLEREQRSRDIENQRLHDPGYGYSNADDAMRARRGKALENSRDVAAQGADPEWRRITEGQERARDLQHPDNFDEFAAARGLGRLDPREAEKLKNDHANERMLSDVDYFSKLDRDKPERTPALEHQNEPADGMPFYSPMGARVVNRWADLNESQYQRDHPVETGLTKDRRERGGGRERSIFDDGNASGESGYGGD